MKKITVQHGDTIPALALQHFKIDLGTLARRRLYCSLVKHPQQPQLSQTALEAGVVFKGEQIEMPTKREFNTALRARPWVS